MFSSGRQFVELDDGDDAPSVTTSFALNKPSAFKSYISKIRSRRPIFLVIFEKLCPKLFYGWVVVCACGIGKSHLHVHFSQGAFAYFAVARLVVRGPSCNFWRWSLC